MKNIVLIICTVVLMSCSLDNGTFTPPAAEKWSLIQSEGGIAGSQTSYNVGEILWTFDDGTEMLIVEKNVSETDTGIDAGTYPYSLETINNQVFLFIDSNEFGAITIAARSFVVDQNITSTGSASDKYVFEFSR